MAQALAVLVLAADSPPIRIAKGLAVVAVGVAIILTNLRSRRAAEIRNSVPRMYLGDKLGGVMAAAQWLALWLAGAAALALGISVTLNLVRPDRHDRQAPVRVRQSERVIRNVPRRDAARGARALARAARDSNGDELGG